MPIGCLQHSASDAEAVVQAMAVARHSGYSAVFWMEPDLEILQNFWLDGLTRVMRKEEKSHEAATYGVMPQLLYTHVHGSARAMVAGGENHTGVMNSTLELQNGAVLRTALYRVKRQQIWAALASAAQSAPIICSEDSRMEVQLQWTPPEQRLQVELLRRSNEDW